MIFYTFLILLTLFKVSYNACQANCDTCTQDQTRCITCSPSYTYVPSTNQCIACSHTNCQSCSTSSSCLVCKPNYQPTYQIATYFVSNCLAQCNIPNCKVCDGLGSCTTCKNQYYKQDIFPYCFPCPYPCSVCTLATNVYSNVVLPFWRTQIPSIYTGVSQIADQQGSTTMMSIPSYITNMINGNDGGQTQYWQHIYFIYKGFQKQFPSTFTLTKFTQSIIRLTQKNTKSNKQDISQYDTEILKEINRVTSLSLTITQYYQRIGRALSQYTQCSYCYQGYYSKTNKCTSCSSITQNCGSCQSAPILKCTDCVSGIFPSGSPSVCTSRCSPNCQNCFNSGNCLYCTAPYSFSQVSSSKVCLLCKYPCTYCKQADLGFCYNCRPPFSAVASNGICYRCDQDSCMQCTSTTKNICNTCRNRYFLLANGTCTPCQPDCLLCTDTKCYQCVPGFRLIQATNLCEPCGPGCDTCIKTNSLICSLCLTGTYFQNINNTCLPCMQGCKTCKSSFTCNTLQNGYTIFKHQPMRCRPGCNKCSFNNPQICQECLPKYKLISGACKSCPLYCQRCTSALVCIKCVNNVNLVGSNCVVCQGFCLTCSTTNSSQCTSCVPGYNLNPTSKLCTRTCEVGCQQCDLTDSKICLNCTQGYSLSIDGSCVKCLANCSSCDSKNITACFGCIQGFYFKNNVCLKCSEKCRVCINDVCTVCSQGYQLFIDSNNKRKCNRVCNYPCATCDASNLCFTCAKGYTFIASSNFCTPNISCNPNCQFCPIGTYNNATLPTIICTKCEDKCATCTSLLSCTNCIDGYYLNAGNCDVCPIECLSCHNEKQCKICSLGYTKQILYLGQDALVSLYNDTCVKCDGNCLTCDVLTTRCTSCSSGRELVGSKCLSQFVIKFQYSIDYVFNTFLIQAETHKFIVKLTKAANISIDDIVLTKVIKGSAIVEGYILTASKTSAFTIKNSLSTAQTGYTLLSSNLNVMSAGSIVQPDPNSNPNPSPNPNPNPNPSPNPSPNPNPSPTPTPDNQNNTQTYIPQQQQKQTNIGLIVGLVVGLVIASVVIAFIVYKYGCLRKIQNDKLKVQDISYSNDHLGGTNDKIKQ